MQVTINFGLTTKVLASIKVHEENLTSNSSHLQSTLWFKLQNPKFLAKFQLWVPCLVPLQDSTGN